MANTSCKGKEILPDQSFEGTIETYSGDDAGTEVEIQRHELNLNFRKYHFHVGFICSCHEQLPVVEKKWDKFLLLPSSEFLGNDLNLNFGEFTFAWEVVEYLSYLIVKE